MIRSTFCFFVFALWNPKKIFYKSESRTYFSRVGSHVRVRVFDPFRVSYTHAPVFEAKPLTHSQAPHILAAHPLPPREIGRKNINSLLINTNQDLFPQNLLFDKTLGVWGFLVISRHRKMTESRRKSTQVGNQYIRDCDRLGVSI